ncbi:conserved hypothetical protein, partial [Ricinus communis]
AAGGKVGDHACRRDPGEQRPHGLSGVFQRVEVAIAARGQQARIDQPRLVALAIGRAIVAVVAHAGQHAGRAVGAGAREADAIGADHAAVGHAEQAGQVKTVDRVHRAQGAAAEFAHQEAGPGRGRIQQQRIALRIQAQVCRAAARVQGHQRGDDARLADLAQAQRVEHDQAAIRRHAPLHDTEEAGGGACAVDIGQRVAGGGAGQQLPAAIAGQQVNAAAIGHVQRAVGRRQQAPAGGGALVDMAQRAQRAAGVPFAEGAAGLADLGTQRRVNHVAEIQAAIGGGADGVDFGGGRHRAPVAGQGADGA